VTVSYCLDGARPITPCESYLYQLTTCCITSTPILTHTFCNYPRLLAPMHISSPLGPNTFARKELGGAVKWIIFNVVPGVSECVRNNNSTPSVTSHQSWTTTQWHPQVRLHLRRRRSCELVPSARRPRPSKSLQLTAVLWTVHLWRSVEPRSSTACRL
jgi:hypothetical protein